MDLQKLYEYCAIPAEALMDHPGRKVPLALVPDADTLGETMARDFVEDIKQANAQCRPYNAIVPCGPKEWYAPFAKIVNEERVSLKTATIFHMDENLDWESKLLPKDDPSNFHTFMDAYFYAPISADLAVPMENRLYLTPRNYLDIAERIAQTPIDYTLGGIGQDGHIAFNQARRDPYHIVTIEDIQNGSARIQENNFDTVLALSQRGFGAAWQFLPPMSLTLGAKECLKAKKVRIYSATGAWKQTAVRVTLFGDLTPEYPMTLLQKHPDARLTVTFETARHPISEHPEWVFRGVNHAL